MEKGYEGDLKLTGAKATGAERDEFSTQTTAIPLKRQEVFELESWCRKLALTTSPCLSSAAVAGGIVIVASQLASCDC